MSIEQKLQNDIQEFIKWFEVEKMIVLKSEKIELSGFGEKEKF